MMMSFDDLRPRGRGRRHRRAEPCSAFSGWAGLGLTV